MGTIKNEDENILQNICNQNQMTVLWLFRGQSSLALRDPRNATHNPAQGALTPKIKAAAQRCSEVLQEKSLLRRVSRDEHG